MGRSPNKPTCPVCHLPMTHFTTGWKCLNIKAKEHNAHQSGQPGKKAPHKGRKKNR